MAPEASDRKAVLGPGEVSQSLFGLFGFLSFPLPALPRVAVCAANEP